MDKMPSCSSSIHCSDSSTARPKKGRAKIYNFIKIHFFNLLSPLYFYLLTSQRHILDGLLFKQDMHTALCSIQTQGDTLSDIPGGDRRAFAIDTHHPISIHFPLQMKPIKGGKPAIRIDCRWQFRQGSQLWEGRAWRTIPNTKSPDGDALYCSASQTLG